jgi:hypothetical protein
MDTIQCGLRATELARRPPESLRTATCDDNEDQRRQRVSATSFWLDGNAKRHSLLSPSAPVSPTLWSRVSATNEDGCFLCLRSILLSFFSRSTVRRRNPSDHLPRDLEGQATSTRPPGPWIRTTPETGRQNKSNGWESLQPLPDRRILLAWRGCPAGRSTYRGSVAAIWHSPLARLPGTGSLGFGPSVSWILGVVAPLGPWEESRVKVSKPMHVQPGQRDSNRAGGFPVFLFPTLVD